VYPVFPTTSQIEGTSEMKTLLSVGLLMMGLSAAIQGAEETGPVIAIHGGAGTMPADSLTPEIKQDFESTLQMALGAGYKVLIDNGSALDAVTAAIVVMEDSPLFNAGRGAVFTHEGRNEMDASIMNGSGLEAGAVGGVRLVRNPILLARRVMENSEHVLLTGEGAMEFAIGQDLPMMPADYFYTEKRWQQLVKHRKDTIAAAPTELRMGTVGAVALDRQGQLAAGTSTGGMTNKRWGRLGDSPVIGAGTYASNEAGCAVSATGHGEYFIRAAVAHDICARVEYGGMTISEAADFVLMDRLVRMGGEGGVIAIDGRGRVSMPFNTNGMYRGFTDRHGRTSIAIYKDE
jgi:beta-aspartyl-peptidase (threonine type)